MGGALPAAVVHALPESPGVLPSPTQRNTARSGVGLRGVRHLSSGLIEPSPIVVSLAVPS